MAAIQNDRDILLQATSPRVVPIPIPIDRIEGLPQALKSVRILSSADAFIGSGSTTTPPSITLTAERLGGLTGPVVWSIMSGAGTVTPSGDTCVVVGGSITGQSITIRARVTEGSVNYDAQTTLTRLGTLSGQATVNLATQTTGAINGVTQVTNLGSLAYTNVLFADQIGSGTFPVGVVYAGTVNVDNLVGTNIQGKNLYGSSVIAIGGANEANSPIYMSLASSQGYMRVRGNTVIRSWNNEGTITVNASDGVNIAGVTSISGTSSVISPATLNISSPTLNLSVSSLQGSTGSRIILKNVVYNVKVNGTAGTTVEFI